VNFKKPVVIRLYYNKLVYNNYCGTMKSVKLIRLRMLATKASCWVEGS